MGGLSGNGSEGLGGRGEGFEVQNQGVTRRAPGEGPKVNGGRPQSQEVDSMDQPQYEQEMPWLGSKDPEGWDRQIATEDVTPSMTEMFGVGESAVHSMKHAVGKMEWTRDRLKKSSEKEKREHPWATDAQAMQIAKDHEREGKNEGIKRVFLFREAMDTFDSGSPFDNKSPDPSMDIKGSPFANKGADMSMSNVPQRSADKPSIEDAHGEFINVHQHYDEQFNGKNLDEIPEPVWKESNAFLSREPASLEGYVSYLVGEDGTLETANTGG